MRKDGITGLMTKKGLDAVLISEGCNMRYHSGFCGGTGYLYLTRDRRVLMTDSRYTTQAKEEAGDFEILEISGSFGYEKALKGCMEADQVRRIGFEDRHMICADLKKLQEAAEAEWVPLNESLELLRCIKEEWEIERIARAEKIGDQAFSQILGELRPGVTERYIAARLDYCMREMGADGNSFDTIVASGINSAKPHAIPTDRALEPGDFVTMDFGCRYQGYCSDMTRTVVIGRADSLQKEIYHIVLEAQRAALFGLRAQRTGKEVDRIARDIIEDAGYGKFFGHGLGHSVGLYIHEEPRLSPGCGAILQENTTMTVEPGIYLPGRFGVRIEDLVVIGKEGCVNLTHSPKELIEL